MLPPLYTLNNGFELVESLAYIDDSPAELRLLATRMIEDEMQVMRNQGLRDYLAPLPPLESSLNPDSLASTEIRRRQLCRAAGQSDNIQVVEEVREIPAAPSVPPGTTMLEEIELWKRHNDALKAATELREVERLNLELMLEFAQPAWLANAKTTQGLAARVKREAAALEAAVDSINKRRKIDQEDFRAKNL